MRSLGKLRSRVSLLIKLRSFGSGLLKLRSFGSGLLKLRSFGFGSGGYCCSCSRPVDFLGHPSHSGALQGLAPELWAPCLSICQNNGGPHPSALIGQQSSPSQRQLRSGWNLTMPYLWPLWAWRESRSHCLRISDIPYSSESVTFIHFLGGQYTRTTKSHWK